MPRSSRATFNRSAAALACEDHFLHFAWLAGFFVVHHADGHVFAHLGRAGDGEGPCVVVGKFAFALGEERPPWRAAQADIDIDGLEAGSLDHDSHAPALNLGAEPWTCIIEVEVVIDGIPFELLDDAGAAAGMRLAAVDEGANNGQLRLFHVRQRGLEPLDHFEHLHEGPHRRLERPHRREELGAFALWRADRIGQRLRHLLFLCGEPIEEPVW